jgi:hypothetical protein
MGYERAKKCKVEVKQFLLLGLSDDKKPLIHRRSVLLLLGITIILRVSVPSQTA